MDEKMQKVFYLGLVGAALLAALAFLIGVYHAGTSIAGTWLQVVLQVAMAIVSMLFCLFVAAWLFFWTVAEMTKLRQQHADALKALQKRASPLISVVLLSTQVLAYLSDKSFDDGGGSGGSDGVGDGGKLAIAVTILLTITFFVANELIARPSRSVHIAGIVVWLLGVLGLPLAIWVSKGYNFQKTIEPFAKLTPEWAFVFGLSGLLIAIMPFVVHRIRET